MAGAITNKSVAPIHLNFQSIQQVLVTDKDGDRWLTTVKEAAQACRSVLDQKAWEQEFEGFLASIHEWAKAHSDVVLSAFVGISSEGLTGVIITKGQD